MSTSSEAPVKNQSWLTSTNPKGEYIRKASVFRDFISSDPSSRFPAEKGRYHLYVSFACPWAHRTLIVRALKGLEDVISFTVVDWLLQEGGWKFSNDKPGCTADALNNATYLKQIYLLADPQYSGNITVPVLWDKTQKTIVNNESSEIIRMLNTEFNAFCATDEQKNLDLYPEPLRPQIEELNSWIYPTVNNGVYRCGFATTQEAYDEAFDQLFESLDRLEDLLQDKRYLTGNALTEADVRLFTTLVRFDVVYVLHFKTNKKRLVDYPNLWSYVRDLYSRKEIAKTVDFQHIKHHYMESHRTINPKGIVAKGPLIDFNERPTDRWRRLGVKVE